MINYSKNPDNFDLNSSLLDAIDIHNNNIHTTTQYRPVDLLKNTDEQVYLNVLENIKKINYGSKKDEEEELDAGTRIIIKKNCVKSNKRLITRKINIRSDKIISTIIDSFGKGFYSIRVDENYGTFIEGEELFADYNQINLISEDEWNILKINKFDVKNKIENKKFILYIKKIKKCKKQKKKKALLNYI